MRRSSAAAPLNRRSMNPPSMARIATHAINPAAKLSNLSLNQAPPSMAAANTSITSVSGGLSSFSTRVLPQAPMPNW
ncbi:hypothetical protein BG58_22925 [Caballeronia jiangsuensis]|nr:hypothetical protein BG58_22925 [Caballeronia jiangsuensis]